MALVENDRQPEPWQTNAAGPFLTIGEVEVWALDEQRFRVVAHEGEHDVEGFAEAQQLAHELAGGLWRGTSSVGAPTMHEHGNCD